MDSQQDRHDRIDRSEHACLDPREQRKPPEFP